MFPSADYLLFGLQAAASIVKTKAVICPFTGTFYSGVSWHLCRICEIISALAAALFVLVWVPLTVRCPTAYSIFRNCGLCGGRNGVYVQETKCGLCVSWGEKERATERHRQINSMWKFLRACVYVCVCVHADCTYTSARSKLAFHLIVWGHTKLIDAGLDLLFIPSIHPSITAKEREGEEKKNKSCKTTTAVNRRRDGCSRQLLPLAQVQGWRGLWLAEMTHLQNLLCSQKAKGGGLDGPWLRSSLRGKHLIVQKHNGEHLEGGDMYILLLEPVLNLLGKGDVYLDHLGACHPSHKVNSCMSSKHLYLWES